MLITLKYNNNIYKLKAESLKNINLARFIFLSGHVPPRPLCAGIGNCGRCKVIFHSIAPKLTPTEEKILSLKEQKQNIRLACRHDLQDDIIIELIADSYSHTNKLNIKIETPLTHTVNSRLFIDIGTTSIAWQCQPLASDSYSNEEFKKLTLKGEALNPQMIAGADIMTRLYTATNFIQNENQENKNKNKNLLKDLIYDHIKQITGALTDNKINVQDIFIAANPSIMALSLGTDIAKLSSAPYELLDLGNRYTNLYDLPQIWVPPQMSPFIGADACAGFAYIMSQQKTKMLSKTTDIKEQTSQTINQEKESFLLADMGTNAEFIFYDGGYNADYTGGFSDAYHTTNNDGNNADNHGTIENANIIGVNSKTGANTLGVNDECKLIGTSVPLGPAIEGVGMRCGGPVHGKGENTILSFNLGMHGLEYTCMGTPKFICGVAYINLIHILLSVNLLNRQGFFQESVSPLANKIAKRIRIENKEKRLYITDDVYVCSEDIENILKVKSAFATALHLLTKNNTPKTLYLSGALSEYIPLTHLENLGFIPQGISKSIKILGNSSLKGLIQLSYSKSLRDEIVQKVQNAHVLNLTADPLFSDMFIENMHF